MTDETTTDIASGSVVMLAQCPHCRLRTPLTAGRGHYDNGHDRGRGGFTITCDSCFEPFVIDRATVEAMQKLARWLVGEA